MRNFKKYVISTICFLIAVSSYSQKTISLSDMFNKQVIQVVNRDMTVFSKASDAVEMNAEKSDGMGILKDVEFEEGTIEIELLGENSPGKSFIGLAFNIQNDSTYEAIYFRPFNFVAQEQIRKDHMVQYIYHPEFSWRKLREERTGEFENEISTPPNPDDWFSVIIKINEKSVTVYVNEIDQPVLQVERLTESISNKIGLWAGFGSSGRFKNLVIKD